MSRYTGAMAVLAALLASCGTPESPPAANAPLPAGERLVLAAAPIADMKAVGAEITTRDSADARARIGGTLVSLAVREGDMVQKGQQLAIITDTRLDYETRALDAQISSAQAEAARAQAELARIRYLYDNKVYAKARLDQAQAAAKSAQAQVAAARAQKGASASVVAQGAVFAPSSGRVLRAAVPAGSVVTPGMSIVTLTSGVPVLRIELPESLAGQIPVGARVALATDGSGTAVREGRVVQVYPAISAGRMRVDAQAPGLGSAAIGRRVGAWIEVGTRVAITVPRRFVTTRYGIDYVDLVTSGDQLSSMPVQLAPVADPAMVEIMSGVRPGDTLFKAGVAK